MANIEEVLEVCERPNDSDCPVVCMDEQQVQLLEETRVPMEATKQHARPVNCESERNGTASILVFAEPLAGYRRTTARLQRRKTDRALGVANLLDTRYVDCEWITLVMDNLNTLRNNVALIGSFRSTTHEEN